MLLRPSQWLVCGLLFWQATQGLCAEGPAASSAQARLEQARDMLVEQAMRASTRVDALSWVDASGRLQEHQSMRQSVQWPPLLGAPAGQAPRDLVQEDPLASQSCPGGAGLHPTLALRTQWPVRLPLKVRERLQDTLNLQWLGTEAQRPWRMFRSVQPAPGMGAYERLLLSPPVQTSPWQVEVRLDLLPATEPRSLRLAWHMAVTGKDRVLSQNRAELSLPLHLQPWGAAEWTDEAWTRIEQLLQDWADQLNHQFACVRPQPEVVADAAGHWMLDMGSLAGLHVGDEWALVDPASLPERTLEAGAIGQMVVARVVRLEAMRAELTLVAGEARLPRVGWVAHPLADLRSAPSPRALPQHARR